MKLSTTKCAFSVSPRKLLRNIVIQMGIEVNPKKIQVIINMKSLKSINELQSLPGQVAALNRFVSRATNRGIPFSKVLIIAFELSNE